MKTSKDYQEDAEKAWKEFAERTKTYDSACKYAYMVGNISATAAADVAEASHLKLTDKDHVEVSRHIIVFYANGKRSQMRGSVNLGSSFMYKKFLRTLIEDYYGEDSNWYEITLDDIMED